MDFLDARRLTGPNLCCNGPGSILDISCQPDQVETVHHVWRQCIEIAATDMGWPLITHMLPLEGGVSLVFEVPIDALYAASAVNEWAWRCISEGRVRDFSEARAGVSKELAEEQNAALTELQSAAAKNNCTFLWDDDEVSLGMGRYAASWPATGIPSVTDLDFSTFDDVPLGIVTGTNGKTTCTRLASFILGRAGFKAGVSCTDWLAVDDQIIDRGDWSGPGGARTILRQKNVDAAILETARGGLLRRGLGVDHADAAVITNIAEDHLGDFGSGTLDELLEIKWIVSRAVQDNGTLILNADDVRLVERANNYPGRIVWFSLDSSSAVIESHVKASNTAFFLEDGDIVVMKEHQRFLLCAETAVPITMGGAAKHNTANVLAAAALTHAMGVSLDDIASALSDFAPDKNPGRCNLYDVHGVQVLVDFAHNPHAMSALFNMAQALPAGRRLLAFGQAGDRPDQSIRELSRSAWEIGLDAVFVSELAEYHRGREHGEVYQLIRNELVSAGAEPGSIHHFELETDALGEALQWAESGDLIIMLALGARDAILESLRDAAS